MDISDDINIYWIENAEKISKKISEIDIQKNGA
jgi:hypothetical protein